MKFNIDIDDMIGGWFSNKWSCKGQLAELAGQPVSVRINSMGGSLDHGLDIMEQLRAHGDCTAYFMGMSASAATIIAMGCKKVVMSKYAAILIHQVSQWVDEWGQMNADEIDQLVAQLQKDSEDNKRLDLILANLYAQKTGKSIEEMHALMKEAHWLTAEQAKEIGLVDEIIDEGEPIKVDERLQNRLNEAGIPSLPEQLGRENEEGLRQFISRCFGQLTAKLDCFRSEKKEPIFKNMKKVFKNACALLGIEDLEVEDGKVTLTEEQMDALEAALPVQEPAEEPEEPEEPANEEPEEPAEEPAAPAEEPEEPAEDPENQSLREQLAAMQAEKEAAEAELKALKESAAQKDNSIHGGISACDMEAAENHYAAIFG